MLYVVCMYCRMSSVGAETCCMSSVGTETCYMSSVGAETCCMSSVGTETCYMSSVGAETCHMFSVGTEACRQTVEGKEYTGTKDTTEDGVTCQRWDSQTPHDHGWTDPNKFPDATLSDAANHCRTPGDDGY